MWVSPLPSLLTQWGRVTHIYVSKLIIIGSDNNGLSPSRRQAIIWTNAGMLLIGGLGINFSENLIEIQTISLKKMFLKTSSAKGGGHFVSALMYYSYICPGAKEATLKNVGK